MRLHRLTIRAFGPFADEQVVDFDALAASGLFLLHGPTGSGKTSVLDALCFALYGRLAGSRAGVTRLRSDHANADVVPEVQCEFTASNRRFQITRSPAWERTKKRGVGTTTVPARVLLREWVDDAWTTRSTRIDEAAHLLDTVVGMGVDQFTKVVLLPQGEFAAFLQSDAEDRRLMLQRLFGTQIYNDIQKYLVEQRRAVDTQVDAAQSAIAMLVEAAQQAVAGLPSYSPYAGATDRADSAHNPPLGEVSPIARVATVAQRARSAAEFALQQRVAAQAATELAREVLQETQNSLSTAQAWVQLRHRIDALAAGAESYHQARTAMVQARQAESIHPLITALAQTKLDLEAHVSRVAHESKHWHELCGDLVGATCEDAGPDDTQIADVMAALEKEQSKLAAATQVIEQLSHATLAHDQSQHAVQCAEQEYAAAVQAATLDGELLDRLGRESTTLAALAATVDAAEQHVERSRTVVAAVNKRDRTEVVLQRTAAELAAASDARNVAWELWLELRERRLAGIAAELAHALTDGEPCRVCGNTQHPKLATAEAELVTVHDEEAARLAHEQAELAATRVAADHAQAQADLAAAVTIAKQTTAEQAAADLEAAQALLASAQQATNDLDRNAAEQGRALVALAEAKATNDQTHEQLMQARHEHAIVAAHMQRLHAALIELVGPISGETTPAAVLDRSELLARQLEQTVVLQSARAEYASVQQRYQQLLRDATAAAAAAGFATVAQAEAAQVTAAQFATLTTVVKEYETEQAAVSDRGNDAELVVIPQAAREDTHSAEDFARRAEIARVSAEQQVQAAAADDDSAMQQVAIATAAVATCDTLLHQLTEYEATAQTLMERHHVIHELSRCVEGTGGDNTLRMSLSAFVVAARLEQVAAAATLRLQQMSQGRYSLVHSDATRGRGRSGLALEVVDAWTGLHRDTATLSGGEMFYTSLALALGLADVVGAENGGLSMETLLIDEGFGSLDAATLDEVMDVLDSLRSGGRAVGIVSHVTDIRDRIPTQLQVHKTPTGSTLTLHS